MCICVGARLLLEFAEGLLRLLHVRLVRLLRAFRLRLVVHLHLLPLLHAVELEQVALQALLVRLALHGVCMACACHMHGTCMAHAWHVYMHGRLYMHALSVRLALYAARGDVCA